MFGKRGDVKWDLMFALITGLIVVSIVMFWIFQEFFTEEEINWEVCRESLIVKSNLPEKDFVIDQASTKAFLPLKCETKVINIDYEDVEKAEKKIGEIISSCWYMVGRGEYEIFPGSLAQFGGIVTPCMACARIHLDREVRDFYSKEENKINIRRIMNSPLEGYGVTVWNYLNPEEGTQAIHYFGGWNDEGFDVKFSSASGFFGSGSKFEPKNSEIFYLPKYFLPEKGDFFIMYGEPSKELKKSDGNRIDPYMVLLQYKDFDKLSWHWSFYTTYLETFNFVEVVGMIAEGRVNKNNIKVCSSIETIPS